MIALTKTEAYGSWGRVVRATHAAARPHFQDQVHAAAAQARERGLSLLPFGLGRSYGDVNLNPDGALLDMSALDRILAFDPETGVLRAEAGLTLANIMAFALRKGWFVATTPGTRFVTLGGAVANDVHGKNHHSAGAFGCSVRRLALLRSGAVVECSPMEQPELFQATVGGLGLTGIILWVEVQLVRVPSAYIVQETMPFDTLEGFFALARESAGQFEHTVAWIDCTATGKHLGRGLFTRGAWATDRGHQPPPNRRPLRMPIDAPGFALNPVTLKTFNTLYRSLQLSRPSRATVHCGSYFYPLDAILGWNRLYGKRGFFQHQCVLPPAQATDALADMLTLIARAGQGSFLAVLKTFGDKASPGLLSFPREGATLALDFANRGAATVALLKRLDGIVAEAGGRLYPAKDGCMSAEMFQTGYPQWRRFAAFVDPAFSSSFWRRVSV